MLCFLYGPGEPGRYLAKSLSMKQHIRSYLNVAGVIIGVLAAVIAVLIVPTLTSTHNDIASMDKEKIRGVWFVPSGKTEADIVWLDSSQIDPLYKMLSSEVIERNPSKWIAVGRIGFTYHDGQNAGVDIYDTQTERGAFRCGDTYFRYNGNASEIIKNAR